MPEEIHIHIGTGDGADILAQIIELREQMTALSDAFNTMMARVDEDFAALRALFDEAAAANPVNLAEIARLTALADSLTAERDAFMADQSAVIASMESVDPDPSNPPTPPTPPQP